jgi:hypothetical protein
MAILENCDKPCKNRQCKVRILVSLVMIFSAMCTPDLWARQESKGDGCKAYFDRSVPKFREGRRYRTSGGSGSLVIYVALAPFDVDQEKLLALTCKLAKDHANEEAIFVYVFDTHRAAMHFNPQGEGNTRETNLSFRARYAFFRDNGGGQGLDWRPDPNDVDRWTHIDLGEPPKHQSRNE